MRRGIYRWPDDPHRIAGSWFATSPPQPTPTNQLRQGAKSAVPLADRAIGNLQQWLIEIYQSVSCYQLQVYLDEFYLSSQSPQATHGRVPDHCSALEPGANLQLINKYVVPWTFPLVRRRPTPTYCLLAQTTG
jgi:hypothetical protein